MIHHNYKLLVTDIDGTLIDRGGSISTEDGDALAKVRHLGIQVSLSTGRATKACISIINNLALDGYHIFFDGALVSDPHQNKKVYIKPISPDVVRQSIEFAHLNEMDLELYSADHYFAKRESWSTDAHRQFFGIEPNIVDFTGLWEREKIIKGGLVVTSPKEAAKAKSFQLHFDSSLHFSWVRSPTYPGIDFINIVAPAVSKGKALEALTSHLGISLAEVMVIGDGTNDISLLSSAGLAIAMGNAPDEVKAVADYITLDVDCSGVAAAIDKFLL